MRRGAGVNLTGTKKGESLNNQENCGGKKVERKHFPEGREVVYLRQNRVEGGRMLYQKKESSGRKKKRENAIEERVSGEKGRAKRDEPRGKTDKGTVKEVGCAPSICSKAGELSRKSKKWETGKRTGQAKKKAQTTVG